LIIQSDHRLRNTVIDNRNPFSVPPDLQSNFGVAPAMCNKTVGSNCLRMGDVLPACNPSRSVAPFSYLVSF